MQLYDRQYDNVIKSIYLTVGVTYEYAKERFVPLIDKLDFQRSPLRASFYKRLEEDILQGCIMPNITLAINLSEPDIKDITEEFLEKYLKNAFVLDGIQRLNTLARVANEKDFPRDRIMYCNILICNSMDRLLYRMITLNNGQKPMTARHQIEILASNIFDFDSLPILAETEKEKKDKKNKLTENTMSKEVLIKGYLAYISGSINIDNQKIIESKMNELIAEQILDSNIAEKDSEYKDVIDYISILIENERLNNWFKIPNNFIGFTAAMNKNFNVIKRKNIDDIDFGITLFEEAFSALDVSKIKLGMARRRLVKKYFEEFDKLSVYSKNRLIDFISQEI